MSIETIYLDYAAATPLDEGVLAAMTPYFSELFYNPSSPYFPAVETRRTYEDAKHRIAREIGAKPGEIIMTAGSTESINLALASVSGHIVTAAIEHPAVLEAARQREHTFVQPSPKGRVLPDSIAKALQPSTELISVAIANNELGVIQPIKNIVEVAERERERRRLAGENTPLYVHVDGSQGSLLDIKVARLGIDMLTLSAGKMYGPKQVGLLWASKDVKLTPLVYGGGQEFGLRSGTENVAGVIGFAAAIEKSAKKRHAESRRLSDIRDSLQQRLTEAFPEAILSGDKKHRLPHFLHISFPGLDGERLVFALESRGVLVATGSACAANKATRSHVLEAIGLEPEVADGSLRITLGTPSTAEQIDRAGDILIDVIGAEYKRVGA